MNPIPWLEIIETDFVRAKIDSTRKNCIPRYRDWDRQNDHRDDSLEQVFRGAMQGLDILGQRRCAGTGSNRKIKTMSQEKLIAGCPATPCSASLLPCPFCGNSEPNDAEPLSFFAGPRLLRNGPSSFEIKCTCDVSGGRWGSAETAVKHWNFRKQNADTITSALWNCSTLRHGMFTPPEFRGICFRIISEVLSQNDHAQASAVKQPTKSDNGR